MVLGPFPTTVSGSLERKINRVRVKKPSRRRANVCNDLYDRRKLLAWSSCFWRTSLPVRSSLALRWLDPRSLRILSVVLVLKKSLRRNDYSSASTWLLLNGFWKGRGSTWLGCACTGSTKTSPDLAAGGEYSKLELTRVADEDRCTVCVCVCVCVFFFVLFFILFYYYYYYF